MKSSNYIVSSDNISDPSPEMEGVKVLNDSQSLISSPVRPTYKRSNSSISSKFGIINLTFDLEKSLPGSYIRRSSSLDSDKVSFSPHQLDQLGHEHHHHHHHHHHHRESKVFINLPTPDIRIFWHELTFDVSKTVWNFDSLCPARVLQEKRILAPQSGEIRAGTLTGLMGPSGAGKSTLLNCITGRHSEGVGGQVLVTYPADHKSLKVSFVPQKDHLFSQFTVKETLVFASKIKNTKSTNHDFESDRIIASLNLETCCDVKVSKCSGGQVKRLSIGVELISHPDVLVLDEPTSGLDSSNAESCIRLLRDLASDHGPAIVCTIHQPNYEIFTYFNNIYVLSSLGQNIYFGPPTAMMDYFGRFDLKKPEYINPADYAIDVANGKFAGPDIFEVMARHQLKNHEANEANQRLIDINSADSNSSTSSASTSSSNGSTSSKTAPIGKVLSKSMNTSVSYCYQTVLLFWRSIQVSCFRSPQLLSRCIMNLVIALLVSFMFMEPTGVEDGCWRSDTINEHFNGSASLGRSESDQLRDAFLSNINKKDAKADYLSKISRIQDNTNFMFAICTYVIMVFSIGTVLIIPLELGTAMKELSNSWYRTSSYFIAKTVADLVPMFLSICCNVFIVYFATQQIGDMWRFGTIFLIIFLLAWCCESFGMMVGIFLSNDLTAATLVTMAASFPTLIYSGYLVRIAAIPWYFVPMTYLSYTRFAFEAVLVTIYGFGRCTGGETAKDFIDDLVSANNPIDLVTTLWNSFNITASDANRFAAVLGTSDFCMQSVVNGTGDYLGINLDGSSSEGTDMLPLNETLLGDPFQPSYVLSYFNLEEAFLLRSLIALCIMVTTFRVVTFIILHFKTKINH